MKVEINDQKLHEVHITVDLPQEVKSNNKYITSCILFCISLFVIPFIILDLYIAYSSDSCLQEDHFITLKTWLEVSGYTLVGSILIIGMLFYNMLQLKTTKTIFCFTLFFAYSLFNLSWLIVGSILFWRDVSGCSPLTNNYLYARLILGYISIFFSSKANKN